MIKNWLSKAPPTVFTIYTTVCAFCVYFCMYGLRKPFSGIGYDGHNPVDYFGELFVFDNGRSLKFKAILIFSQVVGYTLSKFIGIKFISELKSSHRLVAILSFVAFAEFTLLLFAILPHQWKPIALFLNGLPLGMIWGLVMVFLEGRKTSDVLGAGLCCSFIMASGITRSTGRWLMTVFENMGEFWMPFWTGLVYIIPLFLFAWLLAQIPPPTEEDIRERAKREPMNRSDRFHFLKTYRLGFIPIVISYILFTIIRSYRDDFGSDIFKDNGITASAAYATSETIIGFVIAILLGCLILIRNNRKGLLFNYLRIISGLVLALVSNCMFVQKSIDSFTWMVLIGLGLYMAYVPLQCFFFDRLLACLRTTANVAFLIYIADFSGYLGTLFILLYKDLWAPKGQNHSDVMVDLVYVASVTGIGLIIFSFVTFNRQTKDPVADGRQHRGDDWTKRLRRITRP